ncbi:MAG: hypothetical protein A2Y15_06685 [Clostridiales bacterium GWF2_36_10]|nr:MAG: hypothetical protein A2Y15_06685 [Clostridiales bacterium GWF2_36_10]HAN21228.1 GNAT family N-acetyltransferase [Clostridiales bacterium]
MKISKATITDLNIVQSIVYDTVNAIYPNYYPYEVVSFFLAHHKAENIEKDINKGMVFLFKLNDKFIGIGTIEEKHLNRVFFLPEYQGQGYGTQIMDFLEKEIRKKYKTSLVDSSLPAYSFYEKRGYSPIEYHQYKVENNRVLCYHVMKKKL